MINSYKALSGRYLKHNKKRTTLTIIGIVMSVALICSIGTFMVTLQQTLNNQQKAESGNFELTIKKNISEEEFNKITTNPAVEFAVPIEQDMVSNTIKDKQILITKGNKNIFDAFTVKLKEGTIPTNSDEIVLEEWILKYFDIKPVIGSKINLTIGNKTTALTLVGIAQDKSTSQYSGIANGYIIDDSIKSSSNNVSAIFVKLVDGTDKRNTISTIESLVGKDNITENDSILRITGESKDKGNNNALFMIGGLVVGVVAIATIMVIYNSFHISIAHRTKQFGQLRAMGTTRKQIMSLVLREALIMTVISVPIGLLCGVLVVYIIAMVFKRLSVGFSDLEVVISPVVIFGSFLIGALSIFISAILPARGAGKISPLVAISNSNLISKDELKRSKKNILIKYLKIDKVMAIKNVKRNKKRFYITAISMAISVTLFIGLSSFYEYAMNVQSDGADNTIYSFEVMQNYEGAKKYKIPDELIKDVRNISGISDVYKNYNSIKLKSVVNEEVIPKIVRDQNYSFINEVKLDGETKKYVSIMMNGFDQNKINELKPYVIEGSVDNLKDNEIIVVKNERIPGKESPLISPILDLKPGDEIKVDKDYYYREEELSNEQRMNGEKPKVEENAKDNYKNSDLIKLKVAAVIEKSQFNLGHRGIQKAILPINNLKKIINNNDIAKEQMGIDSLLIKVDDKSKIDSIDKELTALIKKYPQFTVRNSEKMAEQRNNANLQIVILLGGFITVITLISSINILNTVSTNIIMRKRELASLKAIGMTSKELRNMICLEGAMFGIYGGVIGCILGSIVSYLFAVSFADLRAMAFHMPWTSMVIALSGVIVIGYISALIPMRKLAKSNIIEGISQE